MDDKFPLGVPVNRPAPKGLVPVPGRPGWWREPYTGVERYIEPPRPEQKPLFEAPLPDISYDFYLSDDE